MSRPNSVPLADLIVDVRPGFASGEEDAGGVFQIRMNNITRSGALDLTKRRRVPRDHKAIPSTLLQAGDVLFNATNSPDLVGKTAIAPHFDEPTVLSNHFLRLRTNESRLHPSYLARWLQYQFRLGVFQSMCRQWVNQATVGRESLLSLKIPLAELGAQQRVVDLLDRAEALRVKRREALAYLDELTQSIFFDMFGDTKTWPWLTVAELAVMEKGSIRTGPFGSQLLHEEFVNEGIAVLGIDNVVKNEFAWDKRRYITPEKYRQLQRYRVHPGDVLISIMGTCGRCAVVPADIPLAINTKHLCSITLDPKKCFPEFVHAYFLLHPAAKAYLARTAKGAIMSGLNMEIIKGLPVALPPLTHQRSFVEKLDVIKSARSTHEHQLSGMVELFDSLQYRAFRGEL